MKFGHASIFTLLLLFAPIVSVLGTNMTRATAFYAPNTSTNVQLPRVTPIAPPNGTRPEKQPLQIPAGVNDRWWIIDYWNTPQGAFPGYTATFTAVSNTIGNWTTNEVIIVLPINIAYGTSSTNCVWFQFSIQFNYQPGPYSPVQWNIQNNTCPATSDSDYHITNIPLPYVVGHSYVASMSPSSTFPPQATFTITDTTSGSSWPMAYTVPSTSVVYASSTFSPASAVEGVPYRSSPSYTNVPYFPFTVQHGQTTVNHVTAASSGFNVPTTINTYKAQTPIQGTWNWAMEGTPAVTSTDKTTYVQGDTIQYTGSGFTPNGAVQACLATDSSHATCITNEPNADSSGNAAGFFYTSTNWPTGAKSFWVYDVTTSTNSAAIPLTILLLIVTTTQTTTSTSTSTSATTTSTTSRYVTTTTTTTTSVSTSTVGQVCSFTSTTQTTNTIVAITVTSMSSSTTTTTTSSTSTFATTTSSTSTSISTTVTTTTVTVCTQSLTATRTTTSFTTFTRPSTTISLVSTPNSISLGSPVVLSGSIAPNPGVVTVTISLSRDSGPTWNMLMSLVTDNSGSYSTSWVPPSLGNYLLEASWSGNNQLAGSTSSPAPLTVTGIVTLTPTLLLSVPSTASRGRLVSLSITVFNPTSPALNANVTVQITGPSNYVYFDVVQVHVAASLQLTTYYDWTVPNQAGTYSVTVGLLSANPGGIDTATIQPVTATIQVT